MPRITFPKEIIEIEEGIIKVTDLFFELPETVHCDLCGGTLKYDSFYKSYICLSNCPQQISAKSYLRAKLREKNMVIDKALEEKDDEENTNE